MKKLFCTSFVLFATAICFSGSMGQTDKVIDKDVLVPSLHSFDPPTPIPGCSHTPGDCPPFSKAA